MIRFMPKEPGRVSSIPASRRLFAAYFLLALALLISAGCGSDSRFAADSVASTGAPYAGREASQAKEQIRADEIDAAHLPAEAQQALRLIKKGGPFPYPQDGTVFANRERLLPEKARGYYHEYTVKTPGSRDRGARRIITGDKGEYYYTEDHYRSFKRILE
jgi:ribonuclease T1